MDKKTPYIVKLTAAMIVGSHELAGVVVGEALNDIAGELKEVTTKYAGIDLPFVCAAMLIVGNAMKGMMDSDGSKLVEDLVKNTTTIAIDRDAIFKQGKEAEQ